MMDFTALEASVSRTAAENDDCRHCSESDEDMRSRDDGRTRSQFSALTASTMLHRIAPWMEEERPLLPHQEAAILLEYARDGQDLNGSKLTLRSRLCYRLRHKFQWLFRIAAWGLVMVHIFERPTWTYHYDTIERWNDGYAYPSFCLHYLHPIAATSLTCFLLAVLWFGVLLEFGYKLGTSYSYLPYISAAILTLKSAAELVVIIKLGLKLHPTFSFSPIEAFMCLLVELQYDNNIGYLLRTMPKFAVLMLTLTCFVCIYTALGFLIFDPEEQEVKLYFNTYGNALWNMLMVLNTSNWPGPMVPAFNYNRMYCAYFYVYIMIMGWGLLNLVLGFNYLFFQQEQRGILEMQEATRVDNKAAAFRLMDVEKKGFLTYAQADDLLKEMYTYYEEMSDVPTTAERYELILVLDIQSNLMIDENDFSFIEQKCFQGALRQLRSKKRKFTRYVSANIIRRQAEILQRRSSGLTMGLTRPAGAAGSAHASALEMSRTRRNTVIQDASHYAGNIADPKLLDLYRSIETKQFLALSSKHRPTVRQWLAYYAMQVDSIYFDILTDSIIFAVGIVLLLNSRVTGLIASYIALSLLEMILKFQVKGLYRYMVSNRNMIDGLIAIFLLVVTIVEAGAETKGEVTHVITKTLVLLRTLLFPRNILVTNGFKKFRGRHRQAFNHAFQSASHFSFLLLVMIVLIYVFAGIGQHAFGGGMCRDCPNSPAIEASLSGQADYYPLNFNDMPSGMVTMFTLLSVNNMHITTSGFVAAYSQWAEVFFACWYALGVLLLLNVLTAVFLDQFTGYMSRLASERNAAEERKRRKTEDRLHIADQHHLHPDTSRTTDVDEVQANTLLNAQRAEAAPLVFEGLLNSNNVRNDSNADTPVSTPKIRKSASAGVLFQLPDDSPPAEPRSQSLERNILSPANEDTVHAAGVNSTGRAPRGQRARADSANALELSRRNRAESSAVTAVSTGLGILAKMLAVDETVHYDDVRPSTPPRSPSPLEVDLVSLSSLQSQGSQSTNSRQDRANSSTLVTPKRASSADMRSRSISGVSAESFEKVRNASDERTVEGQGNSSQRKGSIRSGARGRSITFGAAEDAPSAVVQDYRTSIFASDSDRKKLKDWVASQLPGQHSSNSPLGRGDGVRSPVPQQKAKDVLRPRKRGVSVDFLALPSDWAADLGYTEEIPQHPGVARHPEHSASPEPAIGSRIARRSSAPADYISDESEPSTPIAVGRRFTVDAASPSSDSALPEEKTPEGSVSDLAATVEAVKTGENTAGGDSALCVEVPAYKVDAASEMCKEEPAKGEWWERLLGSRELTLIERAAVLILFAKEGHERSVFITQRARWTFQVRTAWSSVFKVVSWVYALLKFFQRPVWTYYHDRWEDSAVYPTSGMPQVSSTVIGAIKIPLLLVMLFGLALELTYNEFKWGEFFTDLTKMRIARYTLFCYGIAQFIMVCYSLGGGPEQLVPITSVGSILYVLWFNRRAMYKLQVVLKVVPNLSAVLLASLALVLAFAGLGRYLYNTENVGVDDDLNHEYFGTFGSASWSVFVAITTSNYPNQIMPAYRDDRTFFLYFFAFMFIGAFVVLNTILVIVFVEFQKAAQLATDVERASRQVLLIRAYEVLDPHGVGYIERARVALLLEELYQHYGDFAELGDSNHPFRSILIDILDVDYDGKISVQDFLYFLDVSKIKLTAVDSDKPFMELHCPAIYHSVAFQALVRMVNFEYTNLAMGTVIVVLIAAWLIGCSDDLYKANDDAFAFNVIIVTLMLLEVLVKLVVRGSSAYFKTFRNKADFVIAIGSLVGLIGTCTLTKFAEVDGFTYLLRIMLMARLLLFPRNIRYIFERSGVRRFNRLVRHILAQTATIGVVFLCITYMFASIGLYAFGGAINKSPVSNPHYDDLMNSRYAGSDYFGFNFNDFMSGWFTLFSCLHVSDFDLIVSGFTSTVNQGAKLFFILWYIAGVLLMLNILKSFFLGEFLSLFLAPASEDYDPDSDDEDEDMPSVTAVAPAPSTRAAAAPRSAGAEVDVDVSVSVEADDGLVEREHKKKRDGDAHSATSSNEGTSIESGAMKKANRSPEKAKRLLSWSDTVGDFGPSGGDSSAHDSSIEMVSSRGTSSGGTPRAPSAQVATTKSSVSGTSSGSGSSGLGGISGIISAAISSTSGYVSAGATSSIPTAQSSGPLKSSSKKIKLMADADEDYHPVAFVPAQQNPDINLVKNDLGSASTAKYYASTKKVKNLDALERKMLRRRMSALGPASAVDNSTLPPAPAEGLNHVDV